MRTVHVSLGAKSYDIEIERGLLEHVGERLKKILTPRLAVIVTDSNVAPLYAERLERSLAAAGFRSARLTFAAGEESKNIKELAHLYDGMAAAGVTRSDLLIALGGGVAGDMGGLAAATFLRGIKFVQIPTTLLAQVDSSVGGKVAIDLVGGKNLVGAFYQPSAVYIDPELLATLPVRYLHDGLAEVIKYGCIRDAKLFAFLEHCASEQVGGECAAKFTRAGESKNCADKALLAGVDEIVETCCNIKARIVEHDEFDTGERMVLNFGHTLGHAVEKYFHYRTYSHGEGVSIGMNLLTARTEKMGLTEPGSAERLRKLCVRFDLPLSAPMRAEDLVAAAALDKKKKGESISLIVMKRIGNAAARRISFAELPEYIRV